MSPRKRSLQTIDTILLGLLSEKPMHGYDLYKELTRLEGVGMLWRIKQGLLYAILDNLEKEGLITGRRVQGESRPDRKEYHITPQGQMHFLEWKSQPVSHGREMRQDFLARLYFTNLSGPDPARKLLDLQEEACRSWLTGFQDAFHQLDASQTFNRLVLQFRIQQTEGMLEWLAYCKNQLTTGETP